jgi:hypothetical protein
MENYAALSAELALAGADSGDVLRRYSLGSADERGALDSLFQDRMRRDPAAYAAWQSLYWRYHAHFTAKAGR